MSFKQMQEIRNHVSAQLATIENTDDVLELTLEKLSAISGGHFDRIPCGFGCYKPA